MAELLIELFSEEIPARMQAKAAEQLVDRTSSLLKEAGLTAEDIEAFVTPRRLALVARGLPERQPDRVEERKGPKAGAPDKAIEGFLRGAGLSSIDEAELRKADKGEVYFAVKRIEGRETRAVLPEIIGTLVQGFAWPKSMRWSRGTLRWVRPLQALLVVFDGKPVEGRIALGEEAGSLAFTDSTQGHRFLAPEPFAVTSFADYRAKLEKAFVVLDAAERRRRILEQAEALAAEAGLSLKADPCLLEEVTGLVEWPVVLMGRIDAPFMELPPEVLTVSMRTHQKYFALETAEGALADRFLVVANMETEDGGEAVIAGNERVLRARLSDARFFWDQDRKQPLAERVPQLQDVIFHAKLGSLQHKVDRIGALAEVLSAYIEGAEADPVRRAAHLAKADLTTGMVGEFPELQGVMGRYYALADGEAPEVAEAIAEHYAPLGPNDGCPRAPVSVAVALADKIDTLAGFFAIDEKPTGSKDPFALRRAALGIIRLILENGLRLPLSQVLTEATRLQPSEAQRSLRSRLAFDGRDLPRGQSAAEVLPHAEVAVAEEVLGFLADRLKVALRDRGVRHDLITAVFAVEKSATGEADQASGMSGGSEDDLVRLLARVEALADFVGSDDGANLLTAYRRATNIVRIEEKKETQGFRGPVDPAKLEAPEEKALHQALEEASTEAERALKEEDFAAAMSALAALRKPVDAFFDKVTVNAEKPDLRANRLRLLKRIDATLSQVADFSRIEG